MDLSEQNAELQAEVAMLNAENQKLREELERLRVQGHGPIYEHPDLQRLLQNAKLPVEVIRELLPPEQSILYTLAKEGKTKAVKLPVRPHKTRLPPNRRGLSLKLLLALRSFFEAHGALDEFMVDVCSSPQLAHNVCDLTGSTGLSLAESVVEVGTRDSVEHADLVGDADVYLCYAWSGTALREVLQSAERALRRLSHGATGSTPRIWIDVFCASQNLLAGRYQEPHARSLPRDGAEYAEYMRGTEYWRRKEEDHTMERAVGGARTIVLACSRLVEPWLAPPHAMLSPDAPAPASGWERRGPVALGRAWCLTELSLAVQAGARLEVELGDEDARQLDRMRWTGLEELDSLLDATDAHEAQLTLVEDRALLLPLIETGGGFAALNGRVRGAMRAWLLQSSKEALRAAEVEAAAVGRVAPHAMQVRLGDLMRARGDYGGAEEAYAAALSVQEDALGETHGETVRTMGRVAALMELKGDHARAEPVLRRALEAQRQSLGGSHGETLESMRLLAQAINAQGRAHEARPLYEHVLLELEGAHGKGHVETIPVVAALAHMTRDVPRFREALQLQTEALGASHPDTIHTMLEFATLLCETGQPDEAEPVLHSLLDGQASRLGRNHPETLATVLALATIKRDKGDVVDAEKLYRRVVDGRTAALGAAHAETVGAMLELGALLAARRDLKGAEEAYRRVLRLQDGSLGATHPQTLATCVRLADLLRDKGALGAAEPLYRRAADGYEAAHGVAHVETVATVLALADLLNQRNERAGAEKLCATSSRDRRVAATWPRDGRQVTAA